MKLGDHDYDLNSITPLHCDVCGKPFGWIYEFDVQGSYFVCNGCMEKEKLGPFIEEAEQWAKSINPDKQEREVSTEAIRKLK